MKKADYIPVYEYGVKVAGIEPEGTVVQPSPTPTPTPTSTLRPTPTSSKEIKYGDLNNDNEVDSTDVTLMKRYILRKIGTLPNPEGADVNVDGSIDSTDLTILKRYVLRKIKSLPV